ncbi:ABC transporter ATP-binding protein [Natrinema versiforme]|uniref:ABC-type copper transport system involved in multi-copper enzyme maturation, ATP-binding protein n=1 Tax=Natrinema versiforme JCM 10478 TaxID=1227496 RepID=L9XR91_9EURY|nr:ABC transporter ATP-binding protein [Natrinema versiforme]ELY63133.1 ABC-type copper transport system involved in multi-copper enzyme maturation, ATP-binding protein [Natrinema versiforme JCM 10478]
MTAIAADGLSKRYATVTALDRISLSVEEGEIFGFLGPNGAGKSTFINVLLDFVRPTDGSVELFGHDCQTEGVAARDRIGVLPEGYSVFDRLTGRQHVEYARRSKDADDDPIEILDRVGVREAADRPASDYSKGMKQRLVLGMSLVGDPDLLILDEPTTGLDPNGAAEIRSILREERDRGAAIFFSSHILEQVEAICDRVAILQDGDLVAVDTIDGLRQSIGGGTKLLIDVDGLDEETVETVRAVDGVETATVRDGTTLEMTCTNDAKMNVVVELQRLGADVVNFRTEEASLEDMFVAYTGGGRE